VIGRTLIVSTLLFSAVIAAAFSLFRRCYLAVILLFRAVPYDQKP
jgi:hypothetical protein